MSEDEGMNGSRRGYIPLSPPASWKGHDDGLFEPTTTMTQNINSL